MKRRMPLICVKNDRKLKEKKKKSAVMLFLEQFIDVLIALLIVAAIAAYFVGDVIDSCVILIAVLLNTVIGFIQEYRSEKAIEMLKSVTTSYAVVRRDGQVQKIDAKELTIGDIVILEEGDKIPADLVLIETNRLKVDESNLTGESAPVEKSPKEEAYMDSNVTLGNGVGIVTAIGMDTSIKIISNLREKIKKEKIQDEEEVKQALREEMQKILDVTDIELHLNTKPSVILVVGVNGVGKTTSIGKMAARLARDGKKVIVAAADTFRAAAVEQLEVWAQRAGAEVVKREEKVYIDNVSWMSNLCMCRSKYRKKSSFPIVF